MSNIGQKIMKDMRMHRMQIDRIHNQMDNMKYGIVGMSYLGHFRHGTEGHRTETKLV